MFGPNPSTPLLAAGRRTGLLGFLVLLAGFFWSWALAHAAPAPLLEVSHDEMVYWVMADTQDQGIEPTESALSPAMGLICRKPAPAKTTVADLVLNEIADKDVQSCAGLALALPQAPPLPGPQPELPLTVREPLLRPPARLG